MSIYSSIQELLDARLSSATGLPELQLENTRAIGQTGKPFTRATLLPARSTQISLGITGHDEYTGLYQVDIFVPQDAGTGVVNDHVDAVIARFSRGLNLFDASVRLIIGNSWREAGGRVEPFYNVPVVIEWTYYKVV